MSEEQISPAATGDSDEAYRVLARKYRPRDFSDLVGQEAMVNTLTNAFSSGRLAHAFILAGVRGVGKTTAARIVAKALNCTGPDDQGGPTISPCGVCDSCRSIAEDRHVDVLEMDAASRTGVDDIRELIEGVRYRPVSARFKVYIVDEVHMLSRNAFNALLKTLEEPPEHVKFIFATTEIRRVPVTVLSRCQRFDLRRIDIDALAQDFGRIAKLEGANITDAALALIARAADGSHRDGLSLLDQAIATGSDNPDGGPLDEPQLRAMLGLADRARSYDLLDALMRGDAAGALALLEEDYRSGADPLMLLRDLLEIVHWLTRVKAVPTALDGAAVAEIDRVRGKEMTESLSMAALTRAWQMLLKGLQEAQSSPVPIQAV
ncbi:MAG: DNA polymerase III subunit gamma/tau, partial [Proteobacteria bacterium]|nr:DNA polymerase III subunit gamma/tau [Pseudomonadota bacterium]